MTQSAIDLAEYGPEREDVYSALWALVSPLIAGDGTPTDAQPFATGARKLKTFPTQAPDQLPALFQVEPMEISQQRTGMFSKRTWKAFWVAYMRSDPTDDADIGTITANPLMDALERALVDTGPLGMQTLGGLISHAWIAGEGHKIPGDTVGQGMLVHPVSLRIP